MPNVTYPQILALRAEANNTLYAQDMGPRYDLECHDRVGTVIRATLDKNDAAYPTFQTNVLPYCNLPVNSDEVRFRTHDFSDKSDWDGRTHGDQVAYLAGGVLKHPIDGSWLDATGASMIQSYGNPADPHYNDPNYLFGAYQHRITAVYDDVNYKWTSADGTTRYAWLDLSVSPPVWKNDAGTVVVQYDQRILLPSASKATNNTLVSVTSSAHDWVTEPVAGTYTLTVAAGTNANTYKFTYNNVVADNVAWANAGTVTIDGGAASKLVVTMGAAAPAALPQSDTVTVTTAANATHLSWIRLDTSAVVTSSLWRIKPYAGYKIQINEAWLEADNAATFNGTLHYLVYMNLDAGVAGAGYPAGNYQVKDWKYKTMADFQQGSNMTPYVEPTTKAGHMGPVMTMGYNYRATKPQVVDDAKAMHLDIVMDNHTPVSNTLGAHGSFICLKIRSF